jgi:hypothetical protein
MFRHLDRENVTVPSGPLDLKDNRQAVQQGIEEARSQVQREVTTSIFFRQRKSENLSVRPTAEDLEKQRFNNTIGAIPAQAKAAAKGFFRHGAGMNAGSRGCQFRIMLLNDDETSERGEEHRFYDLWTMDRCDPRKLCGAARSVFDYCLEAGYNPYVIAVAGEDANPKPWYARFLTVPGEEMDRQSWYGRFEIWLDLEVPEEATPPALSTAA